MDKVEDGGPAYPSSRVEDVPFHDKALGTRKSVVKYAGMSLRDAFAIGTVSGHLASMNPGSIDQNMAEHVARSAYMVADAMLLARKAGDQS